MSRSTSSAPTVVLYIDDNPDDRDLMSLAVNRVKPSFVLQCVADLTSAKAYLNGDQSFTQRSGVSLPILVLVDYSIGAECGRDLIAWIRSQPEFQGLTTILCTDTEGDSRFEECYGVGVDYCLKKPANLDRLIRMVECLDRCISAQPSCYNELQLLPEYRPPASRPQQVSPSHMSTAGRDQNKPC